MHFKSTVLDAGIYIYVDQVTGDIVIAVVYVDDAFFMGSNAKLAAEKRKLFMDKWESRDLGEIKDFLGMNIVCQGHSIKIDQE